MLGSGCACVTLQYKGRSPTQEGREAANHRGGDAEDSVTDKDNKKMYAVHGFTGQRKRMMERMKKVDVEVLH
ncbi:hypothetical protein EOD39_15497 [Acipenser ruthenus]|uniref:Uncharacterized protein n=1 Tax=Acipenser ruthenus TaxID=7906 RepID=A0A444V830_ACIRT|nr:hypothetical protein EOD39_15497 [Acipenser ruthenus]